MNYCRFAILFVALSFLAVPVLATEEDPAESEEPCINESGEPCAEEELEELERGFDPCLINSRLPACKSSGQGAESGAPADAAANSDGSDDSG